MKEVNKKEKEKRKEEENRECLQISILCSPEKNLQFPVASNYSDDGGKRLKV